MGSKIWPLDPVVDHPEPQPKPVPITTLLITVFSHQSCLRPWITSLHDLNSVQSGLSSGCMMSQKKIEVLAQEWLRLDQDNETRLTIERLLEQQNHAELESRLCTRLAFGTAGLRAHMGAGYAFINGLTIIQTSQGLAAYLLKEGLASGGIVVGYDARHNSEKFAQLAAAAFTAKGIHVWWYEELVHTPMVPFGVDELGAAAGIMITASHNPAQDNGYKVYGSNGCQINTPVDSYIATAIMENLEPITWDIEKGASLRTPVLSSMRAKYFEKLSAFVGFPDRYIRSAPFVYTPMHGVGKSYMTEIMARLEIPSMIVVPEQADPDPDFPTVRYPNPEETGALHRATTLADERGIRLVIANDPDADRFAVAERIDDHWIQFTGDQVGALFTHYLVKSKKSKPAFRKHDIGTGDNEWVLTTAVSSQMISVMAGNDFTVGETLTGFKWLGNRTIDLEKEGKVTHFAYEEALGYMFPDIVRDKDGITAAVVFLCAYAEWGSPWAKMQELYQQYGYAALKA